MNRDELEGKAKALKGKIKQATGDLTNNSRLHDESAVDEVAGKTQGAVGRIRRKVGDVIEDLGNATKEIGVDCDIVVRDRDVVHAGTLGTVAGGRLIFCGTMAWLPTRPGASRGHP